MSICPKLTPPPFPSAFPSCVGLSPELIQCFPLLLHVSQLNLISCNVKGTPEALPFSPSLAGESLPGHPPECWGCGVKDGLWQQGLGHGSERTAWGGEGKELWKLSTAQRCGDVCTQRCQCHHGTFSWGAPVTLSTSLLEKSFFKLRFSSKSSFPEHQTPQTTGFF